MAIGATPEPPSVEIDNEVVKAKLYLPDSEKGYYRGTRFDWSGVIASLEHKGHSYFGVWFDKYDPKIHDAITGPVDEFLSGDGGTSTLGYDEAAVGGTFMRVGVGLLKKPAEARFQRFNTYDIVDHGRWSTVPREDSVTFQHTLRDASSGYGYIYRKVVRLVKGQPDLRIEHSLRNISSRARVIQTDVYNHNFFVIDGQPTGPDFKVDFNFPLQSKRELGIAAIKDRELTYQRPQKAEDRVMTELAGYAPGNVAHHEFRVTNKKTGASVRVTGDKPLSKILYWSTPRVLSPENFISLKIDPGKEVRWNLRYEFSVAGA